MSRARSILCLLMLLFVAGGFPCETRGAERPRKIVLIAGPKSHGPVGNGIHDYPWSVKLLKVMLDNSNVREQVAVEYHLDGWPKDDRTLDTADAIMVVSDGRDGDLYEEMPPLQSPERVARVQKQIDRGCGFLTFHFSTFAPDQYAPQVLDWTGGYFDWEEGGQRKWYSAIQTQETKVALPHPEHPICRGVAPFQMKEEFYFNLRFGETTPLLAVPSLSGRDGDGRYVAWARERPSGGRGFGTTCGHFYDNWRNDDFRRLILNALCWTAHVDVPKTGVEGKFYTHAEITAALSGVKGTARGVVDDKPIRVLLLAGNEAHKWHNWEKTTPVIRAQLEKDPRVQVDVSTDPEAAFRSLGEKYDVLVQNSYANWHDKTPLSDEARTGLVRFLENGGGLLIVHFGNGAWNFSLPMAGESDWPEYRKIVRRVWNHHGKGEAQSGHDAFGRFAVAPTPLAHEITRDLKPFEIEDELYFRQDGTEPIEPLLTASSKATRRNEPLAWTYTYGKGRVFQTLLGHSEKTYAAFEPCEMLRRGVAWSAARRVIEFDPQSAPPASPPPAVSAAASPATAGAAKQVALTEGRFGKGLDARTGGLFIPATDGMRNAPISVGCWTKLDSKAAFNILLASEEKSSPTHWELYSYAGSGFFSLFLPGRGGEYRTAVDICDGKWHHVGMVFEPKRIRLFVDGQLALDRELAGEPKASTAGAIAIGRLVEGGIGCAGTIDDVSIRAGVRPFESLPTGPQPLGDEVLGLWPLDELTPQLTSPDRTAGKRDATAAAAVPAKEQKAKPVSTAPADGEKHWGKNAVGFDWTEKDSVDSRWQQTDIGPFLAYTLFLPEGPVRKGLSIKLNEYRGETAETKNHPEAPLTVACYDTQQMQFRGAWSGGFIKFDPARYGIIGPARPDGALSFSSPESTAWRVRSKEGMAEKAAVQYLGLTDRGSEVALRYRVGATLVTEVPSVEFQHVTPVVTRTLVIEPHQEDLELNLFDGPGQQVERRRDGGTVRWTFVAQGRKVELEMATARQFAEEVNGRCRVGCLLPARSEPQTLVIRYRSTAADGADPQPGEKIVYRARPTSTARTLRWPQEISVAGRVAADDTPFAADTIPLPIDNPWKALLFTTGVDFFLGPSQPATNDGRSDARPDLAVCTVHGDVWTARGVDAALTNIRWRRFATGLDQALGLTIVGDDVYVLGRDQITRLRDTDHNGEADEYDCVNNLYETSAGGHDYVACLERDPQNNFYFVHAHQGVVRAAGDGRSIDVIAGGLRNPNGMGLAMIDGQPVLTAAPQEGEWTPGSAVYLVRPGEHYGYSGPRGAKGPVTPTIALAEPLRQLGVDPPLCWIPRRTDNSCGGQTWIEPGEWGNLGGHWLHHSFGQCTTMLVLQEGHFPGLQGATVPLPLTFDSGICRGRFRPADGHLYVTGLRGWVTSATQDGCLQRVRRTAQPSDLPIAWKVFRNGLEITFASPLDRETAEDAGSYHVEAWNYRYSAAYGSPDWKLGDGSQEGHDELTVKSATQLAPDRVFLEIDRLGPACQTTIQYALRGAGGEPIKNTLAATIHRVPDLSVDPALLNRARSPGQLTEEELSRLRPGVLVRWRQGDRRETEHRRMAAFATSVGEPPAPFLAPGSAAATLEGWIKMPLRSEVRFRVSPLRSPARLFLGGRAVPLPSFEMSAPDAATPPVALHAGYTPFRLELAEQDLPEARLFWSSAEFAEEPVPPTVLFCDGRDDELVRNEELRRGRDLYLDRLCARCHGGPVPPSAPLELLEVAAAPAARRHPPRTNWLARFLAGETLENDAHRRMPRLFADTPADRREAEILARGLTVRSTPGESSGKDALPAGDAERGTALYEDLGCLACHRRTEEADDSHGRRSLLRLSEKFDRAGLAEFLATPHEGDRWNRMPDFRLNPQEIADLVECLLPAASAPVQTEVAAEAVPQNIVAGLWRNRGCDRCHAETPTPAEQPAGGAPGPRPPIVIRDVARGCLAEGPTRSSPAGQIPEYRFSPADRGALAAFLSAGGERTLAHDSAADSARRLVQRLNCQACHSRDSAVSPRGGLTAEESDRGLAPETLPNLTWAGEKLHADWVAGLLAGRHPQRTRPWLKARMPAFPAYAETLARGLAAEHGLRPTSRKDNPPAENSLQGLGVRLVEKEALDCRQCHGLGDRLPTGDAKTLLAPGINFALVPDRIRPEYYGRFTLDPPRFDVTTRMPKLAIDGKTTKVTDILDGDARRQFAAIWAFLTSRAAE